MTNKEAIEELKKVDTLDMPARLCEAHYMAIKALEQEPCSDVISRQAVIDGINEYFHDEYYQRTSIQDCRDCLIEDVIKPLPSVTPQEPQTGRWIEEIDDYGNVIGWHCDKCYEDSGFTTDCKWHCCPNCGCRMVEPQESEVSDGDSN